MRGSRLRWMFAGVIGALTCSRSDTDSWSRGPLSWAGPAKKARPRGQFSLAGLERRQPSASWFRDSGEYGHIVGNMATMTIKSTYSLDVGTVRTLEELARRWNVSKSEAL